MAEQVLPLAVAHRGGNEVAHENTLEAFQDAIDLGYRRIETDVHYTRHGELLAVHGQTLDGSEAIEQGGDAYVHIGERALRIADLTRADRQALAHDGLYIPTVEEALSLNREVYWNIDAKRPEAVAPLLVVLRRLAAFSRVTLASFDEWSIRELRARAPTGTQTSLVAREIRKLYLARFLPWDPVTFPRPTRAQVPSTYGKRKLVTRAFVRAAHRHGIPVDVWTINNQQAMGGLLDSGVDGMMTDALRTLKTVLEARGLSLSYPLEENRFILD
jgi:glycerophosphoryl diester phosphodiesterase